LIRAGIRNGEMSARQAIWFSVTVDFPLQYKDAHRGFTARRRGGHDIHAASRLTPQGEGGRAVTTPATAGRYGRIPRLYVEALEDRSVILPVQRAMQARVPDALVVSMPSGHAPQFSAPADLAEAIIPFLAPSKPAQG
jgi:pimeloyl-ACP methyl ester carboxylesterase